MIRIMEMVCDRCGRSIADVPGLPDTIKVTGLHIGKHMEVRSGKSETCYDLCHVCSTSFKLFLKGCTIDGLSVSQANGAKEPKEDR